MVKAATLVGVFVLAGFFVWRGVIPGWNEVSTDFANYYVSSRLMVEGQPLDSLYDPSWFKARGLQYGAPQTQKFAPFPPITAFAALPYAWLEILPAQRLCVIFNIILLCCCIQLVRLISGWDRLTSTLFLLLLGLGLSNNVRFGQAYIAALFVILLGYWLVGEKKEQLSGAGYSAVSVTKYFAIIYLPAFWMTGRRKFVITFLAVTAGLIIFQFLFFGFAVMREYLVSSLLPHLDGRLSGQGIYHYQFQSWESFLSFLFVADSQYNPQPFLDLAAAKTPVKYFLMLALVGGALSAMRMAGRLDENQRLNAYLAILGISGFALLPASATYHFVMLAFPVLMICTLHGLDRRYQWSILLLYSAIGFIPYSLTSSLGNKAGVFFGFPRLWAVTALFVVTWVAINRLTKNHRS